MAEKKKKTAVSSYDRQKWLDYLEGGKGITEISVLADRDIRIVKRHLEIAQEERTVARVRHDFLLGKMAQHHDDLSAEIGRVRHLLSIYPPSNIVPADSLKAKIHYALREHIKRFTLGNLLEDYENSFAKSRLLKERIRNALSIKETQLNSAFPKEIQLNSWTSTLIAEMDSGRFFNTSFEDAYDQRRQHTGAYDVRYLSCALARSYVPENNVARVKTALEALVNAARVYQPEWEEDRRINKEIVAQITEELEVLTVKRLIPGRCSFCPV